MGLFDSFRSVVSVGEDDLTLDDLRELRDDYEDALRICDYILHWAEHNRTTDAAGFASGDEDFIMYEYDSGRLEYVGDFPDAVESEFRRVLSEFDAREAETAEEARRYFREHERFAEKTKDVIEDFLDELDGLEEKMERVEYMQEADEEFEHDGFEDPTLNVSEELGGFFEERVEDWESEQGSGDEGKDDKMEKMDINQLVYFIGEELRKRRGEDYDVEFHSNLASAYPEQVELIYEELPRGQNKLGVEHRLDNFGSHGDLPPLKDKHIEFYILPRVFEGVPSKTPEEIGML